MVDLSQLLVIELSGRFIHEESGAALVPVEKLGGDIVIADCELGLELVGVVTSGGVLARIVEFLVIVASFGGLNVDVSIEVAFYVISIIVVILFFMTRIAGVGLQNCSICVSVVRIHHDDCPLQAVA